MKGTVSVLPLSVGRLWNSIQQSLKDGERVLVNPRLMCCFVF